MTGLRVTALHYQPADRPGTAGAAVAAAAAASVAGAAWSWASAGEAQNAKAKDDELAKASK